ncbi:hypothetical protein [Bordetella flabilis]|uniref:hypothetical protein n=1 Tax=Bordetella flabilis TaxID=463014 RepID=UPI0009FE5945|nr:hypothetical protein [Bordetella flabilis]
MIETWKQYTCDGCGETEHYPTPNATNADVRQYMRRYGWQNHGRLDYCSKCVKNGNAARRVDDMNH